MGEGTLGLALLVAGPPCDGSEGWKGRIDAAMSSLLVSDLAVIGACACAEPVLAATCVLP